MLPGVPRMLPGFSKTFNGSWGTTVPYESTPESVSERITGAISLLSSLGSSRAIADHLGMMGFKGRCGSAVACPVANYVKTVAGGGAEMFRVCHAGWSLLDKFELTDHDVIPVPYPVRQFILDFDSGFYPGLRA